MNRLHVGKTALFGLLLTFLTITVPGANANGMSFGYARPNPIALETIDYRIEPDQFQKPASPWTFIQKGGPWKTVRPVDLFPNGRHALWIRVYLPRGDWRDPYLLVKAPVLDFAVYRLDKSTHSTVLIYKSRDGIHEPVYDRSNRRIHLVPLKGADGGGAVYIRVQPNPFQYPLAWGDFAIGERAGLIWDAARRDLLSIILCIVLILTGMGLLGFQLFYLKNQYPPFVGIGILAACTGIHFFALYSFSQFIVDLPSLKYYAETLTFYLFPVGGILFVGSIIDSAFGLRQPKPGFRWLMIGYTAHAGIMGILDACHLISMWATHRFFEMVLIITLVYLIGAIIRAAGRAKIDLKIILGGGILSGITDLHDILGVITGHLWLGQYTAVWGMMILVIAMTLFMITNFARSDRQLKAMNQKLEERVAKRTGELAGFNAELQAIHAELNAAVSDLQATEIQLIQSEKMALLGQLISGIAHEINTPLGSIKSNTEMEEVFLQGLIADEAEQPEAVIANIKAMNQINLMALERITDLVKNLKNFARAESNEPKWVDLREGIESTLLIISHRIKGHIRVNKEMMEIPRVLCRPYQLNQVFLSLLLHSVHNVGNAGQITIRTWPKGNSVQVEIEDDGPGMAAEDLDRIFHQGYIPKAGHASLGLAIGREIVERHDGRIFVKNQSGIGTVFCIELPVQGTEAAG